jgi:peptide/nickel transport system permease protein
MVSGSPADVDAAPLQRRPFTVLAARAWGQTRTKVGVAILLVLLGVIFLGPLLAPASTTDFVAAPYAEPSDAARLGADTLGRDVLSRFLSGGMLILGLSVAATAIGLVSGVTVGLVAAYSRSRLDDVLMRSMDVVFAFPSIVLALVAVATVGPTLWLVVLAVGITHTPRVARVIRGASLEIVERDFVSAAEAIGVSRRKILLGEIMPNIMSPLMVEASLRLTASIGLIAGLSFLGFGVQPPAADWGLMINENRQGLTVQPWAVVMPVIAIALLTIATGLIGEGFARASAGIDRGDRR